MSNLVYVDPSAVVRLVFESPESPALKKLLDRIRAHSTLYTSQLAVCEVHRVARRENALPEHVSRAVSGFDTLVLDSETYQKAGQNPDQDLDVVEALHLAVVQQHGFGALITYSPALAGAAKAAGIAVLTPQEILP